MRRALFQRAVALRQQVGVTSACCSRFASTTASATVSTPDDYGVVGGDDPSSSGHRLKSIGRALETYLNEARKHSKMMAKEREEFELGKRHLANIMGLDINNITQDDIDKAIEYLFPSSLTDKLALPVMKPPDEIFPKFRKLDFDDEGRPLDLLFYTLKPNFFRLLSDIGNKVSELSAQHAEQIRRNEPSNDEQALMLKGTVWLDIDAMKKKLEEKLNEEMYGHLLMALENLSSHPLAWKERDFIFEYRQPISGGIGGALFGPPIPEVEIDPKTNRRYARSTTTVKRSTGKTTVTDCGTGEYVINDVCISDFRSLQSREIFLAPLILTDLLGKVDVVAEVEGPGGTSVVPRVVRHGVALGVAALYPEFKEKLRLAGLLTRDPRMGERNKINQPGPRAKWIWKKR